jgi:parallel beta helix pectate lyase-like protein
MKRTIFFIFAAVLCCFCAMTTQAQAQATRTWVSGVGDDANPCSRTAPCKTFAGAISKTADCGEIDALDPGGFGTVTITKGIKIDGGGGEAGQVASILAGTGSPGITLNNTSVNCPMDVIRNLDINGTQVGTIGINVVAGGTLALENVDIEDFTAQCVNDQPSSAVGLTIYNSNFERCGGGALVVSSTSFVSRVVASRSQFSKSTGTGVGINAGTNAKITLRDCDVNNNLGGGVLSTGATAAVLLQHSTISNNQSFGVHTVTGGTVFLSDSNVTFNNGTGLFADTGTITTWNNNYVVGNSPDGARTGAIPPM